MIKSITIRITFLVLIAIHFANDAQSQWSLNGNSGTNPPTNFLGTTDNKALVFKTNNSERMRISNAGKVGIGVITPGYKLDVAGDINVGSGNTFRIGGYIVIKDNTTLENLFVGADMGLASVGSNNACFGNNTFVSNSTGYNNTAIGNASLSANTDGFENAAIGFSSLSLNKEGYYNTGVGPSALKGNISGFYNTGVGEAAMLYNTTGSANTAVGGLALGSNITGSDNTGIGAYTDVSANDLTNATALGFSAIATSSNLVMLGNTSVTSVMAAGSFVVYSDGRFKKNIKEDVPGLTFINQLRPVTYNYDIHGLNQHIRGETSPVNNVINDAAVDAKEKINYTGFIAQQVEEAAKKIGYDFSGIHYPANDHDAYGLSYSDFVVPLVKAVQELSAENDSKDSTIVSLQLAVGNLQDEIDQLKASMKQAAGSTRLQSSPLGGVEGALGQNLPNPFDHSTIIPFSIPKNCHDASIMIANISSAEVVSVIPISCNEDHVQIDAGTLSSGTYSYTLYVNGNEIATKQMIITK